MPAQWPEQRTPILIPPTLDATGGRSYRLSSQAPGALDGRRHVVRWFSPGTITNGSESKLEPTIKGGYWRIIAVAGRVRIAPSGGTTTFDVQVDGPDHAAESIFETIPTIADGTLESDGGILKETRLYPTGTFHRIYPPGDFFLTLNYTSGGTPGEDLTVEMHCRVMPVSQ